jgi:hypothetical protein
MSTDHGEAVTQPPISEAAKILKNMIPANIPDTYPLNPMFNNIASETRIRNGVVAFRDFIYLLCDRLISDGHLYAKPQKTNNPSDYQFLHNINNLLVGIGYQGTLSDNGDSLLITDIPSFIASMPKIPFSAQMEALRFLSHCGFTFTGIDLEAKMSNFSKIFSLEILNPKNPILLTGLKVLSVADMELRTAKVSSNEMRSMRRYNNDDNLLRCDYRLIKSEDTDVLDILKDYLRPLPDGLQRFAVALHRRYTDMGMTSTTNISTFNARIAYSNIMNSKRVLSARNIYDKRVWEFAFSMRFGNCLVVRAKKIDKYTEAIKQFPESLRDKIIKGYGCDRKLRNERCQFGCQGILLPLDDSILEFNKDIEIWLDNEMSGSPKK